MGAIMTKLEKEDEHQANWRKVCTNKLGHKPEKSLFFEELHILRGGKARICACPSLIWPDNYSLIVQPECLSSYLQGFVNCDILVIWNFNSRDLHNSGNTKTKGQGTNYVEILPHLLRALISSKLEPQYITFQDCDFSHVKEDLFKDFLYSQVGNHDLNV